MPHHRMFLEPAGVVIQVWLSNVPAGLEEDDLEGVHGDIVIRAMSARMHVVVTAPMFSTPPINTLCIPAHSMPTEFGHGNPIEQHCFATDTGSTRDLLLWSEAVNAT